MARYGMVINLALCMRCSACMVACKTEHQIPVGKHFGHEYARISVLEYEEGKYPAVKRIFAPILCMQCNTAPCMDICPTGAISRSEGIIVVNTDKCNGCKLCMQVCPYNALYFDEEKRVVDKCDFCANRLEQGLEPACVATCMGRAMVFGDLDDPYSEVSRLVKMNDVKPERPLFPLYFSQTFKPSVYYTNTVKSENPYLFPYKRNPYSQEMIDAVVNCLKEEAKLQRYPECEECKFFEKEFADSCGRKCAISNSSGSASLHIALLACGIGIGDEVLLTPHVAYAVGNTVLSVGARPVFVDIDAETLNMDPSKIEGKITSNTKAIIPVHTYGHPADMDPIMEIARQYGLFVIEDGTYAIGSRYKEKRLPIGGDKSIGIFSFNGKQLWLPAGGGMIVTDNEEIARKAMLYRDSHKGAVIGYNYVMHSIAAAVGRIQLRYLGDYVAIQRSCAKVLNELLRDTPVVTPAEKEWAYHAYARYAILAPKRDGLVRFLNQQRLDYRVLYVMPTHLLELYETFGYKQGDFPVTERVKKEELCLMELRFRSHWEFEHMAKKIVEFYA